MSVLDLCDTEVAAVPVDASAAEAIRLMLSQRVGAVVVVDSDHKVAGIFTELDVLRKLALSGCDQEHTPAGELSTPPVEFATLSNGPGEGLGTMIDSHF